MAAEAAERQRQLNEALARRITAAEGQIAAAKERALSEIHQIAIEVGLAVTERITGSAPDTTKMEAAVDRAMAEHAS
jgi:F-type H+-transporting ATPase subunit b